MLKKCILILLDGLGDRSYPEIGGTPLQAAKTPNLNKISKSGSNGLYHSLMYGYPLSSEIAHLLIFGYRLEDFCGRGAFEALGYGVDFKMGDVAFMAKFTSVKNENGILKVADPNPLLTDEDALTLSELVNTYNSGDIKLNFTLTKSLIGILTLRGDVSPFITDTDPFLKNVPVPEPSGWKDFEKLETVQNSAKALKDYILWSHEKLSGHEINKKRKGEGLPPVNFVMTQRPGALKPVKSFHDRWGMKGCFIASGAVYKGLSEYIGLDFHKVNDSNSPGKDIEERIHFALNMLDKYDYIHIHTKAPDEAAHKKDPLLKKKVIESLDSGIGRAMNALNSRDDLLLVITADHSTPSEGPLIHSGEPVPVIFHGKGVRIDRIKKFDEISCAGGALGLMRGRELMMMVLNYINRTRLAGIADSPVLRDFWPGEYKPFRTG